VVVVDVASFGSVAALCDLATGLPGIPIVAIGAYDNVEDALACLEAGVAAYVSPGDDMPQLVDALGHVLCGQPTYSPAITGAVFRRLAILADECHEVPPTEPLTPREREIAGLLAKGLSNREIGRRLFIQTSTVKNHVHAILHKQRLSGRADAASRFARSMDTALASAAG
jgi:DNA-binding NarL/FixJ family response regulator